MVLKLIKILKRPIADTRSSRRAPSPLFLVFYLLIEILSVSCRNFDGGKTSSSPSHNKVDGATYKHLQFRFLTATESAVALTRDGPFWDSLSTYDISARLEPIDTPLDDASPLDPETETNFAEYYTEAKTFTEEELRLFIASSKRKPPTPAEWKSLSSMLSFFRLRIETKKNATKSELKEFVGAQARDWNHSEKQMVLGAIDIFQNTIKIEDFFPDFKGEIGLIKTTGREEQIGNYTRGNNIILRTLSAEDSSEKLATNLAHEAFHVLSRKRPVIAEKMYNLLGFAAFRAEYPSEVDHIRLTTPDTPVAVATMVRYREEDLWVSPVLVSSVVSPPIPSLFTVASKLARIRRDENGFGYVMVDGRLSLLDQKAIGYFQALGFSNAGHFDIHPEEMLAVCFEAFVFSDVGCSSSKLNNALRSSGSN